MQDVDKVKTYLKLFTEICRRNSRLLDIFLKLYHLINGMQRVTWNSIDTSLHVSSQQHSNSDTISLLSPNYQQEY
jgi:hypothetical protein